MVAALTWKQGAAVRNRVRLLFRISSVDFEGTLEFFCKWVTGCEYPVSLYNGSVSAPRSSADLDLDSWNFSVRHEWQKLCLWTSGYLTWLRAPDTGEGSAASGVAFLYNPSFLPLPLGLTIKKRKIAKALCSVACWVSTMSSKLS